MKAIQGAQSDANWALSTATAANAQRAYEFETQTEEERAWRQAQLDASQPSKTQQVMDVASLLATIYAQDPEGSKKATGGFTDMLGITRTQENATYTPSYAMDEIMLAPSAQQQSNETALAPPVTTATKQVQQSPFDLLLAPSYTQPLQQEEEDWESLYTEFQGTNGIQALDTYLNSGNPAINVSRLLYNVSMDAEPDDVLKLENMILNRGNKTIEQILYQWMLDLNLGGGLYGSEALQSK
jgi:hypothetical protein